MAEENVDIKGLEETLKKLTRLGKLEKVYAGLKSAGLYLKGKVAKYPPRKRITIAQVGGWASERQRRWFFAALRSGEIQVPYKRGISPSSQALGRRWTMQHFKSAFQVVVGNNVSYARFVMGDKQSRMMDMIGWETVDEVAAKETKYVREYVYKAVMKAIEKP
jgi:hypothetical protein